MINEKKSISITITNLDDFPKVLEAIENLFRVILIYYAKQTDLTNLYTFVLTVSEYFGQMLKALGYSEKDLPDEK